MQTKAEAIRAIRVQSIINENFGFLDKNKRNADFLDYFYQLSTTKDPKWSMVYAHFEKFVKGSAKKLNSPIPQILSVDRLDYSKGIVASGRYAAKRTFFSRPGKQ